MTGNKSKSIKLSAAFGVICCITVLVCVVLMHENRTEFYDVLRKGDTREVPAGLSNNEYYDQLGVAYDRLGIASLVFGGGAILSLAVAGGLALDMHRVRNRAGR